MLYENYTDSPTQGLSRSTMNSFSNNMTLWIHHIKTLFPDTPLVYHTHTIPKQVDNMGKLQSWNEGGGVHQITVNQINTIGMSVAIQEGLYIVDLRELAASFPSEVLHVDSHHPHDWFNIELLNIYLNIYNCVVRNILY